MTTLLAKVESRKGSKASGAAMGATDGGVDWLWQPQGKSLASGKKSKILEISMC